MKNLFLLVFFVPHIVCAQLPTLADTFPAPCGTIFDYSHNPTGSPDPVGFRLISEQPCLPISIVVEHGALIIEDVIETWVHSTIDSVGWVRIQNSDWHSGLYYKIVQIPPWADDILFVSYNNLYYYTIWSLRLTCNYPPLIECCEVEVEIEGPQVVCPGEQIVISSHIEKGFPPFEYQWNDSSVDSFLITKVNRTRTFFLNVIDSFGCPGFAQLTVSVPKSPVVSKDTMVCPGSFVFAPPDSGVVWQSANYLQVFSDTTIWGIVLDTFFCVHFVPFEILVQQKGDITPNTKVCENDIINLEAKGFNTYLWRNLSGEVLSSNSMLDAKIEGDSFFVFTGIDSLECEWVDTIFIEALYCAENNIYAPNVITDYPTDPQNGFWRIFFPENGYDDIEVQISIWDRWGDLIWISSSEPVWNGFCTNGKKAPAGVYTWQARIETLKGVSIITGDITILR